ncbi:tektin-2 [Schistosoma bovis]|uniref:Tektin n=2 Tax=Schistosoma TaxID=6181 RepID=A0A430Q463_SCHBO|nr:tektin-2 [Schistosoma bovis]CAH8585660.1 unnamed protein product [Schistosoma intercalatum]CAH8619095.1 unnamed protein product [Schistosoma haematobium]
MATVTKPDTKRTYLSWFENLHTERKAAEGYRNISYDHRQLVRATRIETDINTKYDQLQTNNHLSDRIWIVRQWRDKLITQLNKLKQKDTHLKAVKHKTQEFMIKLNDSFDVNIESLTHLDHRQNDENIIDPVFKELNKERDLLKEIQTDLQRQIDEAIHLLVEINNVAKPFYSDILNKNEAVHIDIDVYNLNEKSSCISQKPFCERLPESSIDLQTWENISYQTLGNAENVIEKADDLLHRLHNSLHKAINRMASKASQVDNELRRRIHDTLRSLREIEYQIKSTENERDEHLKDIKSLEDTVRAKKESLKLAETRLEKRHNRSGNENIRDDPQLSLLEELSSLRNCIDMLEEKLTKSRSILSNLEQQIVQLHYDTQQKRNALQIYEEIHNIRKRLDYTTIVDNGTNTNNHLSSCPMMPSGIQREPVLF